MAVQIKKGGPVPLVIGLLVLLAGLLLPVVLTNDSVPLQIRPSGDKFDVAGDQTGTWILGWQGGDGTPEVQPGSVELEVTTSLDGRPLPTQVPTLRSTEETISGSLVRLASVDLSTPGAYLVAVVGRTGGAGTGSYYLVGPATPYSGAGLLRVVLLVVGVGLILAWLVQYLQVRGEKVRASADA